MLTGLSLALQFPAARMRLGRNERGYRLPFSNITTGDQLGRIEIAVAPSNPNYIYAQRTVIREQQRRCGNAAGCQDRRLATRTAVN